MSTIIFDEASVRIPAGITDRLLFRRWLNSDDFPETGRICYLAGEVWADMSKEQLFSHNQVKNEFAFAITGLVKAERLGTYFPDGALVGNAEVDFTAQPDGTFVSRDALATGRVRLVEGVKDGYLELEGSPDMVLEVVSDSSVEKDNVLLRNLYWQAGITEYWLVDARGERLRFDILRHASKAYVATRRQNGWLRSEVFGKSFQLTRQRDEQDNPEYTLAIQS
jgi:Uma2 family endonuclease